MRDTNKEHAKENIEPCLERQKVSTIDLGRIKPLLRKAVTNLLKSCYQFLKEGDAQQGADLKTELSVVFTGAEDIL